MFVCACVRNMCDRKSSANNTRIDMIFLLFVSRTTSGCNGIFSRRLDFSTFNMLPKTRLNSYQIKVSAVFCVHRANVCPSVWSVLFAMHVRVRVRLCVRSVRYGFACQQLSHTHSHKHTSNLVR